MSKSDCLLGTSSTVAQVLPMLEKELFEYIWHGIHPDTVSSPSDATGWSSHWACVCQSVVISTCHQSEPSHSSHSQSLNLPKTPFIDFHVQHCSHSVRKQKRSRVIDLISYNYLPILLEQKRSNTGNGSYSVHILKQN